MIVYSDKYKLSKFQEKGFEFEVLNELKNLDCRTDDNCLKHTRFLFEMDEIPLKKQQEYILQNKNIISRVVFSGSKSYHSIIQFDDKYEEECKKYYKEIWRVINQTYFGGMCDRACSNPSRLTRLPNAFRRDKGTKQSLLLDNPNVRFDDADKVLKEVKNIAFNEKCCRLVSELFKPQQTNNYKSHDGMCIKYDVIRHYLDTPYTKICGNGDSNISLFKALATCIKYNDNETLNKVIQKAKSEKWTDKEIDKKIFDIKLKQRQ